MSDVPPGTYAGGARSPIAWVWLCAPCGGYAPITSEDYSGGLSGQCQGCGSHAREVHRFRAVIDSAGGCNCRSSHPQVTGDLRAQRRDESFGIPDRDMVTADGQKTGGGLDTWDF